MKSDLYTHIIPSSLIAGPENFKFTSLHLLYVKNATQKENFGIFYIVSHNKRVIVSSSSQSKHFQEPLEWSCDVSVYTVVKQKFNSPYS